MIRPTTHDSALISTQPAQHSRPLRVGVVGTGFWARWCHATVLQQREDIELVGVWGRNADRVRAMAQEFDAGAFLNLDELLASVDALTFAVPPDVQAPLAERAAIAGRHLLLDKPLALDLGEATRVVEAVRGNGVACSSFMTMLFQPKVKDWLAELDQLKQKHGPWEGVAVSCAGSINSPGNPFAESAWRHTWGGLWDWGPHALSLITALLPPVDEVQALRGVRDTTHVAMHHVGGAISAMTCTVTAPTGTAETVITVWGPGGRHRFDLPAETYQLAYSAAVDGLRRGIAGEPQLFDIDYAMGLVDLLSTAQEQLPPKTSSWE